MITYRKSVIFDIDKEIKEILCELTGENILINCSRDNEEYYSDTFYCDDESDDNGDVFERYVRFFVLEKDYNNSEDTYIKDSKIYSYNSDEESEDSEYNE